MFKIGHKIKNIFIHKNGIKIKEFKDFNDRNKVVNYVTKLCDGLNENMREEKEASDKLNQANNLIEDLNTINSLDDSEKQDLDEIVQTLNKVSNKRNELKDKINSKVKNIKNYHEDFMKNDFDKKIKDIEETEEKLRLVKSDINYLEGEKGLLEYKKDRLIKLESFSKKFIIGLSIAVSFALVILLVVQQFTNTDITIPGIIVFISALFAVTWILILKRYINHQLIVNDKEQKSSVQLLNKVKLKYVRYTKYLNYEYRKYKINDCTVLKHNYQTYIEYNSTQKRYKKISQDTSSHIERLETFLSNNNISCYNYIIDNLEDISTTDRRLELLDNLKTAKPEYKDKIQKAKLFQETAIKCLDEMKYKDSRYTDLINKIIDSKIFDLDKNNIRGEG